MSAAPSRLMNTESLPTRIRRVAVATDRSETGEQAAVWAADFAERFEAELLLIQVVSPSDPASTAAGEASATMARAEAESLADRAVELAGEKGRARLVVDSDPARAIVAVAEEAGADVLVVGNDGMSGRREFLLSNVPNRVSHAASTVVIIVNTTGGAVVDTPRRSRRHDSADAEHVEDPHLMARATWITRVMARHGIQELFTRADPDDHVNRLRQAKALRGALEELGPTFCKLGQVLSTRPDLLPPEFITELVMLQDDVARMPEVEVVQTMERELGVPWEDVFESIHPEPLAAGTIAQVHRATLAGGDRVVVKVQRPTARGEIDRDLGLLELFASRAAARPGVRRVIDLESVFSHLGESLHRELDFVREADNIERMREIIERYDRLAVPSVYHELSTSRLLVMQDIQGTPIAEAPPGMARTEAAEQIIESYYRQILDDGFFHADPHPGNLLWWKDTIYFLDFGMVGEVGPEMREKLILLLMALWQEDVEFLTDVIFSLAGDPVEGIDIEAFKAEIDELVVAYRHVKLEDIQLGAILQKMTEISMRHRVPLPASLTLTAKALAQMQFAAAALDPNVDPFDVASRFLMRNLIDEVRSKLDYKKLYYQSQKLRVRAGEIVEAVERMIGAKPGPRPAIQFRSDKLERSLRRVGRHLALGLTASAAILSVGIVEAFGAASATVSLLLGGLAIALSFALVVDLLRGSG